MQRIFIGDVQGCADELHTVCARAKEAFSDEFELWVVGDLVNRGPDNRRALEIVRELVEAGRGEYVLGNHEIHLISAGLGVGELFENDSIEDVLSAPDASEWVEWLRRRPVVVADELAGQPFAMLHASASPDWSLEDIVSRGRAIGERLAGDRELAAEFLRLEPVRDPVRDDLARLTRGRSGDATGWSSAPPVSLDGAWHRAWAAAGHAYGIVYGHWAKQGLHVADGLRGLDTGCVHHGRGRDGFLTAWLPATRSPSGGGRTFDAPDDRFWQIPARRRYYYPSQDRA